MTPAWIEERVGLAGFTTMRVGGPARWFAQPGSAAELAATVEFAAARGLPILTLGGGSNLIVADAGVEAVVVRLRRDGEFGVIRQRDDDPLVWTAGGAAPLPALVAALAERGVTGLEFMAGIPGSVGGAAAMNAGGADDAIGQVVAEAEVMEADGRLRRLAGEQLGFGYRRSALAGRMILGVGLVLTGRGDPETVARRNREYREKKAAAQPVAFPSAGCIFKNPHDAPAGRLLDEAGAKGMRQGGAEVSGLHANFIINAGGATARDVALLAGRMREAVLERFGIALEPEITLWGEEAAWRYLAI